MLPSPVASKPAAPLTKAATQVLSFWIAFLVLCHQQEANELAFLAFFIHLCAGILGHENHIDHSDRCARTGRCRSACVQVQRSVCVCCVRVCVMFSVVFRLHFPPHGCFESRPKPTFVSFQVLSRWSARRCAVRCCVRWTTTAATTEGTSEHGLCFCCPLKCLPTELLPCFVRYCSSCRADGQSKFFFLCRVREAAMVGLTRMLILLSTPSTRYSEFVVIFFSTIICDFARCVAVAVPCC